MLRDAFHFRHFFAAATASPPPRRGFPATPQSMPPHFLQLISPNRRPPEMPVDDTFRRMFYSGTVAFAADKTPCAPPVYAVSRQAVIAPGHALTKTPDAAPRMLTMPPGEDKHSEYFADSEPRSRHYAPMILPPLLATFAVPDRELVSRSQLHFAAR